MSQSLTIKDFFTGIDAFFIKLLAGLFVITLMLASWHNTWVEAFVVGLPAVLVPFAVSRMMPGHRLSRYTIASALMVFSALMIHQGHGMLEMHFAIFALMAGLLYYRDKWTILCAALVIAVHHLTFNYMQEAGMGVYVFEYHAGLDITTGLQIVLIHAAFVVAEAALLMYMAHNNWREFRQGIELNNIGNHLHQTNGLDLTYRVTRPVSQFSITFNNFFESVNNLVGQANTGQVQGRSGNQITALTLLGGTILYGEVGLIPHQRPVIWPNRATLRSARPAKTLRSWPVISTKPTRPSKPWMKKPPISVLCSL